MTRKTRKQKRKKKQTNQVSKKEKRKVTLNLFKALMRLPTEKKFCNQTFVTEEGENGCFPFGNYYKDVLLCKFCFAKEYCTKEKAKHTINLKEWRCCNE